MIGEYTTCFSCGHIHDLEMCPQRYLSPHTEDWNHKVGQEMLRLGWKPDLDNREQRRIHLEAIKNLQEKMEHESRRTDPRQDLQDAGG